MSRATGLTGGRGSVVPAVPEWLRNLTSTRARGLFEDRVPGRRLLRGLCCGTALALCLPTGPGQAFDTLRFDVTEGADQGLRDSLEAVSTLSSLEAKDARPAEDVLAAAQGDYTRLVEALYAQGHYAPTVRIALDGREAALIEPFSPPATIRDVVVTVDPGPAFRFGTAQIAPLAPDTPSTDGFAPDAPALATVVRAAAQEAVEGWRLAGHAKAEITGQQIAARHEEARLDVSVAVDPGPKLTFGEVTVASDSAVKAPRIRQVAGIPRGETYSPQDLDKAAARLRAAGPFRSVTLTEAEAPNPDGSLDVEISVTDRPPRRFGFGAELTSDEGGTISSYWLHRNLFGGAERFRVDGKVRQLGGASVEPDYTLSLRIEKPAVYGPDTLFYATAELSYEDEPDYLSETAGFGIGVNREFSDELTGDLGITLSRSRVTDLYLPGNPVRELDVLSFPMALTWDTRDVALDATKGRYIEIGLKPFSLLSGQGGGGARLDLDLRSYRGFGEDNRVVLAGRVQFGALSGLDAAEAPPDDLYYSGGGGTVRGQPFESLDADYNGTALGGRSFLGLSGEVRVDVTGNIGVVGFADAGYIGGESFYDGSGDWHAGAGFGLRYDTPVGPLRVDVAGPLTENTGNGAQLYIGIGQAF